MRAEPQIGMNLTNNTQTSPDTEEIAGTSLYNQGIVQPSSKPECRIEV